MDKPTNREMGVQPIDAVLNEIEIPIADIIQASPEQLTFKNFKSARKGRFLSRKLRDKITKALNLANQSNYQSKDLFNYN